MVERSYSGGCLCGAVRFRVSGPGTKVCFCHCRSCRLASGAPFVAWATFAFDAFVAVGEELLQHASSPGVLRGFCATCGSAMTYHNEQSPGEVDVALAVLDDPAAITPACHIWVSHKLPWVVIGDGLPQYAEWRTLSAADGGDEV